MVSSVETGIASTGLVTECRCRSERCKYIKCAAAHLVYYAQTVDMCSEVAYLRDCKAMRIG